MIPSGNIHDVKQATIERFTALWQSNFLANKSDIARRHGVKIFFGKFRDLPGIVVGAGPSLDKNIKYLKYAQERSVIIACDAALQILVSEGITPSFVVVLDPQDFITKFFQDIDTRQMILIVPTIVHPKIVSFWQGRVVFYNKFAPDIPLLNQIERANRMVGSLTPGGSVLSIGYDFAFKTGCSPVVFVGQDLSYSDEAAYARSSLYSDLKREEVVQKKREHIVFEKDMFGQTIPTLKSMSVTKTWFEWAFGTWKRENPLEVINSTEGGILLKKCFLMPLSEAMYRRCRRQVNLNWSINKIMK